MVRSFGPCRRDRIAAFSDRPRLGRLRFRLPLGRIMQQFIARLAPDDAATCPARTRSSYVRPSQARGCAREDRDGAVRSSGEAGGRPSESAPLSMRTPKRPEEKTIRGMAPGGKAASDHQIAYNIRWILSKLAHPRWQAQVRRSHSRSEALHYLHPPIKERIGPFLTIGNEQTRAGGSCPGARRRPRLDSHRFYRSALFATP